MPELADVEGFKRSFSRHARGKRVSRVAVAAPEMLRNTDPRRLGRALAGKRFQSPRRRGKWLIAPVDGRAVLFHFGMTGGLSWHRDHEREERFERAVFHLEDGALHYLSVRKFGGIWLTEGDDEASVAEITGALGPDADALRRRDFVALVGGRRKQIKSLLMDQALIAGLGNELADEILWRAGVRPSTQAAALDEQTAGEIFDAMRDVLRASKRAGRIPGSEEWLRGQREAKQPTCPRCGRGLERDRVGGRTTFWCRQDQRG